MMARERPPSVYNNSECGRWLQEIYHSQNPQLSQLSQFFRYYQFCQFCENYQINSVDHYCQIFEHKIAYLNSRYRLCFGPISARVRFITMKEMDERTRPRYN